MVIKNKTNNIGICCKLPNLIGAQTLFPAKQISGLRANWGRVEGEPLSYHSRTLRQHFDLHLNYSLS